MVLTRFIHWLKGLSPSTKSTKGPSNPRLSRFLHHPSGKRPKGFFMPKWAQKDSFEKKDLGTMVPPGEFAEDASLRRPGDWLKKKIAGTEKIQQFESLEKTKHEGPREVGMSDKEIDHFLGKFLRPGKGNRVKKSRKNPKGGH